MSTIKTVLILCTGNSCRSQLAEALVNNILDDRWLAFSAGTDPAVAVHPLALKVLDEIGIRHSGSPKHVDEFRGYEFDRVITVCDDAAEACPVWLGKGSRVHIGFPDPAKVEGTPEEILMAFRKTRDEIADRVLRFLDEN